MQMGGGFVISIDIRSYFDTIEHRQLRAILDQRVRDGVIRRTIDKWLKAGVLENWMCKPSGHRCTSGIRGITSVVELVPP